MTNAEFYKDKILNIINANAYLGVKDDKPIVCYASLNYTDCKDCELVNEDMSCDKTAILWLCSQCNIE